MKTGKITQLLHFISRSRHLKLAMILSLFILILIVTISQLEGKTNEQFKSPIDVLYFAIVTISTVGFGDILVLNSVSKILTVLLIMSGVLLVSLMTATFASIFTTTRIREGMGLKKIELNGHVIICGFNSNIERVIQGIIDSAEKTIPDIVLVNSHQESEISGLIERYHGISIQFVSGDYTIESTLLLASIATASSVIILADPGPEGSDKPDERTLLSTLTVKSMSKDIVVCAEVLDVKTVPHLRRAGVDQIVISGEFSGFLLANAVMSPGIPQAFREIINIKDSSDLRRMVIHRDLIGKTFREAAIEFIDRHNYVLLGIITEKKSFTLENVLSGETSTIDSFIRRKFDEAGRSVEIEAKGRLIVNMNPGRDYEITEDDSAIVLTPKREEA